MPGTVLALGAVSFFTDISSEMVTTILPLYLVFSLGMSPLQFGIIDGIQQGASSLVRVIAGYTADRFGRYKSGALPSFANYTGPGVHLLRSDPEYVDRARRAGHETYVWTVDRPEDIALCRDLGVRYVATNAPANTRRLLTANLAT